FAGFGLADGFFEREGHRFAQPAGEEVVDHEFSRAGLAAHALGPDDRVANREEDALVVTEGHAADVGADANSDRVGRMLAQRARPLFEVRRAEFRQRAGEGEETLAMIASRARADV